MASNELSDYVVDDTGSIYYKSNFSNKLYPVWGIAEFGLVHGLGAYDNYLYGSWKNEDIFLIEKRNDL